MSWLARSAVRRPVHWLSLGIAVTVLFAIGIPRLRLETGGAALYPRSDPVVELSEADRLRFEEPRHVVLLAMCPEPGCLASTAGLRFLREVQDELESLSAARGDGVRSLASLLRIEKLGARLSIDRHLDRVPESSSELEQLLATLRDHPLTDGLLLSQDARVASFFVPLAEHRPVSELVDELVEWRESFDSGGFELLLTGPELAEATLGEMVLRDLSVLVPAMLLVVSVLLYVTLGSLGGVIIPMIEAGVVLVWTFGAMGWLGIPVTLVTTIMPVVLMAMAITDEIHLLERVGAQDASLSKGEAVLSALSEVGRPIVMTSVTTALGFLSFLSASIEPMRQFGVLTGFGILAAMLLTFCWIPALVVLLPIGWTRPRAHALRLPGLGLEGIARSGIRRPTLALTVGLGFLLAAMPGVLALRVQDSWVDNFDPEAEVVRGDREFNVAFWGSYRYDVVFEAPPGFFYSSAGTRLIEDFLHAAARLENVGGVVSHLTPLGEVAKALGETPPLSALPELAVADLVILTEMSTNRSVLRGLLTDRGDAARLLLYVNDPDYAESAALRADLDLLFTDFPLPEGVRVHTSGDLPVALEVVGAIVGNQVRSIGWALLSVALVLALAFGRGLKGLVAMVPVVAATLLVLGAMGHLGVPLGIATSMFASLTVGVGVDFGIHFVHRYRMERDAGADDAAALTATVDKAGRALRWNALVLAMGFAVLGLSSLKPNHSLGFLLAAAMMACYLATLVLLPRLARYATLTVAATVVLGALPPATYASEIECPTRPDPAARRIMAELEQDVRSATHVVHMRTRNRKMDDSSLAKKSGAQSADKTLWAVIDSDTLETRSVYVFSGPGRLAGTTLLMRDRIGTLEGDAMWLYLRGFDSFTRIESTERRRTLVPGTSLTYEDAKGYIATDKYAFAFDESPTKARAEIIACPMTPVLRRDLGYRALHVSVDLEKRLVVAVDYRDLAGKPLKRYRAVESQLVRDRWLPELVVLEHLADRTRTSIEYDYWLPAEAPPRDLYEPGVDKESFRPRMLRYLNTLGLQDRILAELSEADASVRRWEEKWGGGKEDAKESE